MARKSAQLSLPVKFGYIHGVASRNFISHIKSNPYTLCLPEENKVMKASETKIYSFCWFFCKVLLLVIIFFYPTMLKCRLYSKPFSASEK